MTEEQLTADQLSRKYLMEACPAAPATAIDTAMKAFEEAGDREISLEEARRIAAMIGPVKAAA
jgi:hypothetical protein